MVEKRPIDKLTIKGFKSLQDVELELGKLNVLIGPNGSGKSNLVSYFQMLREMLGWRLQVWVAKRGGAGRVLTFGARHTAKLVSRIEFDEMAYEFHLEHTDTDQFTVGYESLFYHESNHQYSYSLGTGKAEVGIHAKLRWDTPIPAAQIIHNSMLNWGAYHFHDTSETAPVKSTSSLHVHHFLRPNGSNLAAYLYWLKHFRADAYEQILKTAQLAIPILHDFQLEPNKISADESTIQLMWRQKDSDYPFLASQLSDGSLRFICLVTALMQPEPPSTIIIDEPELGLHPYAIHLLGALLRSASQRMQVIVATQSTLLLDEFSVDDLITVELQGGLSVFKRLEEEQFAEWLKDFSVGELWSKNVLGGGIP